MEQPAAAKPKAKKTAKPKIKKLYVSKGAKPRSLSSKAGKRVKAYKSKPRGVSAKKLPKGNRPKPVSPGKSKRR